MNKKIFFIFVATIGVSIFLIYRTNTTHKEMNNSALNKASKEKDKKILKNRNKQQSKQRTIASIDSHTIRKMKSKNRKRARYVSSFSDFKKNIIKGQKLKYGTESGDIYKVKNFVALKKEEYKESFGQKIKFLNNYIIFEPNSEFKSSNLYKKTNGVVQFAHSGDIGVLTGMINLQVEKNISVSDEFFKKYKVEVQSSVKAINFFYVSPDNENEIYQVAQNLLADENVIKAYVEILSNPVIPN